MNGPRRLNLKNQITASNTKKIDNIGGFGVLAIPLRFIILKFRRNLQIIICNSYKQDLYQRKYAAEPGNPKLYS